ncbi:hypothetical protein H5410_002739 [Solanum commersonii]|uniref:Ubiquitin-like protease family profile domain-containing protein n=1 Tax=Solanum commersonii TaxID=4109 RepID=A0A9J6B2S9_SOLCO|nr:hypothetical protein H5410_002739 [Solanum commersonii]
MLHKNLNPKNLSYHTVDNIFIPVNVKKKLHWVLIVISFNDHCIKVWTFQFTDIKPMLNMTSLTLSMSKAYPNNQKIVAAYMEFLSEGKDIPTAIDTEEVRIRYASLLWNYDIQKLQAGTVTANEASLKPTKNRTESDSSERIIIQ